MLNIELIKQQYEEGEECLQYSDHLPALYCFRSNIPMLITEVERLKECLQDILYDARSELMPDMYGGDKAEFFKQKVRRIARKANQALENYDE